MAHEEYLMDKISRLVKEYHDECEEAEFVCFDEGHLEEFLLKNVNIFDNYLIDSYFLNVLELKTDKDGYPIVGLDVVSEVFKKLVEHLPEKTKIVVVPDKMKPGTWSKEQLINWRDAVDSIIKDM